MPDNLILQSLPPEELARIMEHSTRVTFQPQDVLFGSGTSSEDVFFLESGMVSLITLGSEHRAIETGVVSREGLVDCTIVLGTARPDRRAVAQIGGLAVKTPGARFQAAYERIPSLRTLVNWHARFLLFQAQQNALCHALHSIEARFCRWILQMSDNLESNVVDLTQELCSQVLGVQRTSVSMVAHGLQTAGAIRTRRGKIEIRNREALQQIACECYLTVRQRLDSATEAA